MDLQERCGNCRNLDRKVILDVPDFTRLFGVVNDFSFFLLVTFGCEYR